MARSIERSALGGLNYTVARPVLIEMPAHWDEFWLKATPRWM